MLRRPIEITAITGEVLVSGNAAHRALLARAPTFGELEAYFRNR